MATGLKSIADTLKKATGDLATLQVETYTGKLGAVLNTDKTEIDWSNIFASAVMPEVEGQVEGHVNLVLATQVKFDGDATHFVADGEIPEYILKTHADAVKNGSEYRSEIVTFLAGKVAGILD